MPKPKKTKTSMSMTERTKRRLKAASVVLGEDQGSLVEGALVQCLDNLEAQTGLDLDTLSRKASQATWGGGTPATQKTAGHSMLPGDEE